ncbi:hypothetical protein AGMMS50218_15690 [Actinomycetota bacterium]|nr:hypothetical protein AGMMS50218_15690 [Actinomycetota bacterium]
MTIGANVDIRPTSGRTLIDHRTEHPRLVAAVAAALLVALTTVVGVTAATPARAAEPSALAAASTWRMTCTWGVETLGISELAQCKGGTVVVDEVIAPGYERHRGTVNMVKTMGDLGAAASFQALWQRCEGNFIFNLAAGTAVTYVASNFKILWKAVRG